MSKEKDILEDGIMVGGEITGKIADYIAQDFEKTTGMSKSGAVGEDDDMVKLAYFIDGNNGIQPPYKPSFLTLSDTEIPSDYNDIFKYCKYLYTFDPLIAGAINALANFPITEILFEDNTIQDETTDAEISPETANGIKDESTAKEVTEKKETKNQSKKLAMYEKMFKNLNIYKNLIEIGIDYNLYGNCFIFGEMAENPITKKNEWKRLVRLSPEKIIIDYNQATGEKKFKWEVPDSIKKIIRTKKPGEEYAKIPDIIKQAVAEKKAIILNPKYMYHFSRASDSGGDNQAWGASVVANVLKLVMYRNTLRQAQEAIAKEHIVPFRIFYLDSTATNNVQANWNAVAEGFAAQLAKSVRDPNYKVVSPVPVNLIEAGGNGRALMLTAEIEQVQAEILAGMNIPREFIFGGVGYSGSSISLRILENFFITFRLLLEDYLQNFIIKRVAEANGEWKTENDDDKLITVRLAELKMQDDVQQKQLILTMNTSGKVSDDYLWKSFAFDSDKMKSSIEKEAIEKIEFETKMQKHRINQAAELQKYQMETDILTQQHASLLQEKYGVPVPDPNNPMGGQVDAQGNPVQAQGVNPQGGTEQQPMQGPAGGEVGVQSSEEAKLNSLAKKVSKLPEAEKLKFYSSLPPEMAKKIHALVSGGGGSNNGVKGKTDMRPMPQQKPPRRDSLK